jgi:hypothetical protein
MKKLVKNLTGFIRASLSLGLKSLVGAFGPTYGVSTFIPSSFLVTMTHSLFDKIQVKHSLELGLLVIIIQLLRCFFAASECP